MSDRGTREPDLAAELARLRERLRESEAGRSAAEALARFPAENPCPILRVSAAGELLFANRASAELLAQWGCVVGELVPEELRGALQKALVSGQHQALEFRCNDRELAFAVVPGSLRQYVNLYGSDITERKRLEAEILAANRNLERRVEERAAEVARERQRLFEVLETLPAMICLLTPERHVSFANRAFRDRFGEANGRPCHEFCFGNPQPCDFCQTFRVLETGQPHHWEVVGSDGSVIEAYDFPFTDVDGAPLILEMDLDITERRQAEEALRRSEALLNEAQRIAQIGSWDWDATTDKIWWSEEYYRIYGFAPHSPTPDYQAHLAAYSKESAERLDAAVQEAMATGAPYELYLELAQPTSTTRWILARGEVKRNAAGAIVGLRGTAQNVTERKLAEDKLKLSLSLQTATIQATTDGILVIAEDGSITDFNARFAVMWGIPQEIIALRNDRSALGFVLDQLVSPQQFLAKVEELYASPDASSFDVLEFKDGRVFERYSQPQVLDGKAVGRVWSFRDVSARKQAEAELRESEERFRSLFENLHAIALLIDPADGAIVDANGVALSFYGWSRDELLARKIDELNTLSHEQILQEMVAAKSEKRGHFLFRHRRADGQIRDVEVYSGPVQARGRVLLYSIIHDVTARRQTEEALRQSERLFREAIDFLPIPIGIATVGGTILHYNKRFSQVFGYTIEDIPTVGSWMLAAYPDPDYRETVRLTWEADAAAALAAQEATLAREYRVTGKDGQLKYVEIVMRPVGGMLIASFYDLSELRRSEIKLWENTRELENLAKSLELRVADEVALRLRNEQILVQQAKLAAIGETIGAIAHQWRQPLNSLGLIIQNLQDAQAFGELGVEQVAQTVERSMEQIRHMSKTIDDFRNFFRPDKEKSVFDVMRAVNEVLALFSAQLQANRIGYRLHCHPCEQAFANHAEPVGCQEMLVCGYRNEFEHVLLNLVNNARDAILASREGGDLPSQGRLIFDFYHRNGKVIVVVGDNGGGIAPEVMPRLFEPYFTTKEQAKGTGLGLYMSKMIIEDHMGGTITVANGEGGAVFTISLPLETRGGENE